MPHFPQAKIRFVMWNPLRINPVSRNPPVRIDDHLAQQRIDLAPLLTVRLDEKSRDETVKLIRGLQAVYAEEESRRAILDLIARDVLQGVRRDTGRPGLDLWSIFVLLCCREALRLDYDRLEDLAENHRLVRAAMGLGEWQGDYHLEWSRSWRNVRRVKADTVAEINRRVLQLGHQIAPAAAESVRTDSFVMQTNVHHPSDIRRSAMACGWCCGMRPGWRTPWAAPCCDNMRTWRSRPGTWCWRQVGRQPRSAGIAPNILPGW
jgi:hypothetical protein